MPVGFAVAGAAVLGYMGQQDAIDASNQQSAAANASANRAADLQYQANKDNLDFNRQYYNEVMKPAADFDMQTRREMTPMLIQQFKDQEAFANDQRQDYLNNWKPVESQVRNDAMGYDSQDNVNRRMGIAAAGVNQQMSNARDQGARALSRMGVSMSPEQFARMNERLTLQEGLGAAGAQTGAAFDTQDKAIALRAGAANFGRNMPNTASNYYSGANSTSSNAAGITAGGVNTSGNAVAPLGSAMNSFNSGMVGAGGIYNNVARNGLFAAQQGYSNMSSLGNGIMQVAGTPWGKAGFERAGNIISNNLFPSADAMNLTNGVIPMADGGAVHGPGGPRDDSIPAKLSNGEFVLNEGAVKHFGLAKLEKMNEIGLHNERSRGLMRRS